MRHAELCHSDEGSGGESSQLVPSHHNDDRHNNDGEMDAVRAKVAKLNKK